MTKSKTQRLYNVVAMFITAWLFAAEIGFAQSTGTVRGIVKDPSGAVIKGADAVLTNRSTQQQSRTVTADAGTYSFIFLTPGEYSLRIEQSGFSAFVRNSITVDVAGVVIVDATLQVGGMTDAVTVAGAPEELQASTSDLGHVVDNTMMNAVPLSSRNFTQILALSPGVTANVIDAGASGRNSVNISANGGRPWDNNVVLNGLNADNPMSQGFDDAPDKTGVPVPSPDAIEEFKVQTGLYDAEFGKQGGGTVNMVTKSGGAQYHGSAFEFFRNTALDANSFFQNASGAAKPIFRQNQYGGTVGGPVVKDKVFFFVSYEGTNQANGISSSSNKTTFLPVVGNRTAQALGSIYGGQTGIFGGTAIAADGSNINPVALALLNTKLPNGQYAIPDPTVLTSATTGYSAISAPAIFNEKQIIANGDAVLNDKQRLSLKTLYSRDPTSLPFQSSTTVLGYGENDYHSNVNLSLSHTYTISPTIVNQIRLGYTMSLVNEAPVEPFSASSIGMTPPTELNGTPSIAVNGMFTIGTNRNNSQVIRQQQIELADTLNKVIGRHQIRIGGSVDPTRVKYSDLFAQRGEIVFQSFPDFLLGMSGAQNGTSYSNLSQTLAGNGRPAVYPSMNNFAAFVQDDFRVN
ncbi:MAG TPA: carboxypeptidase regulatory-like domain-containing protein, partial [Bryobacteraceae bacterium]|nr:carboxypeptidase regulatory-like domain-containing protein [Bryobacteraceae bacterium]